VTRGEEKENRGEKAIPVADDGNWLQKQSPKMLSEEKKKGQTKGQLFTAVPVSREHQESTKLKNEVLWREAEWKSGEAYTKAKVIVGYKLSQCTPTSEKERKRSKLSRGEERIQHMVKKKMGRGRKRGAAF